MGFPKIFKRPEKAVTMPELSGGINLRDAVSAVLDNQLTDGKNVWFKDAVLKTRPGIKINEDLFLRKYLTPFTTMVSTSPEEWFLKQSDIVPCITEIYKMIDGKRYRLYAARFHRRGVPTLLFQYISADSVSDLPEYSSENHTITGFFVVDYQQALHCFVAAKDTNGNAVYKLLRHNETDGVWEELSQAEYYIPLAFINGDMHGVFAEPSIKENEDYNLFTHRYRMQFHADTAEPTVMRYVFEHRIAAEVRTHLLGEQVIARLADRNGNIVTHTVTLTEANPTVEPTAASDGLRMQVWGKSVVFANASGVAVATPEVYTGLKNNVELELPFWDEAFETAKAKIFHMTRYAWYGGSFAGINSGARLFLCGNTEETDKNLVLWSDLNNIFYFPQKNGFRAGDATQAVTAFGKQNESLLIFKERELFYTYDKQSSSAQFPLVLLHSSIGCDCPNSIQLCRNRLVWANKNGKVYTMSSSNQYSTRNVYEISGMMERRLGQETEEDLAAALSCDWQGMYCLFVGNHIYLMDYNSYGYQNAQAYFKGSDSNVKTPWWYWELPEKKTNPHGLKGIPYSVFSCDGELIFYRMEEFEPVLENDPEGQFPQFVKYYNIPYVMRMGETDDETPVYKDEELRIRETSHDPIETVAQTKIFDFGLPQCNKSVALVNIAFGNNGGSPISVTYITENGEYAEEAIRVRHRETDGYSAGYVRNRPLHPCVGLINRFGLKFSCLGNMAVNTLSVHYRETGGTK